MKTTKYRIKIKANKSPENYTQNNTTMDLSPHYRKLAIEPREYAEKNKLTFGEGEAIKYITCHRYKAKAEDLKNAIESVAYLLREHYGIATYYEFKEGGKEVQRVQRVQEENDNNEQVSGAVQPPSAADDAAVAPPHKNVGNKRPRTPAQLEALRRGREALLRKRGIAKEQEQPAEQPAEEGPQEEALSKFPEYRISFDGGETVCFHNERGAASAISQFLHTSRENSREILATAVRALIDNPLSCGHIHLSDDGNKEIAFYRPAHE